MTFGFVGRIRNLADQIQGSGYDLVKRGDNKSIKIILKAQHLVLHRMRFKTMIMYVNHDKYLIVKAALKKVSKQNNFFLFNGFLLLIF